MTELKVSIRSARDSAPRLRNRLAILAAFLGLIECGLCPKGSLSLPRVGMFVTLGRISRFGAKLRSPACSFGRFAPVFRTFLGIVFCLFRIGSFLPNTDQVVCCRGYPTSGSPPRACIPLFSSEKSFRSVFEPRERRCLK